MRDRPIKNDVSKMSKNYLSELIDFNSSRETKIVCSECTNKFSKHDLRPYKYEPKRLVCEDCHDQLMEER